MSEDCVSKWISKLYDEGKYEDHDQIVAIAHSKCENGEETSLKTNDAPDDTKSLSTKSNGEEFVEGECQICGRTPVEHQDIIDHDFKHKADEEGTSTGAKKGWDTRKRGGKAPDDDSKITDDIDDKEKENRSRAKQHDPEDESPVEKGEKPNISEPYGNPSEQEVKDFVNKWSRANHGYPPSIENIMEEFNIPEDNAKSLSNGVGLQSDLDDSDTNPFKDKSTKDIINSIKGGSKDWRDWKFKDHIPEMREIERRNQEIPKPEKPEGYTNQTIFRDDPDAIAKMEAKVKYLENVADYWKKITKFPVRDWQNELGIGSLGDRKWYEMSNNSQLLNGARKKLEQIKNQGTLTRNTTYKPDQYGKSKPRFYYTEEPKQGESHANEEGIASVSGPPAGTEPTVKDDKVTVLPNGKHIDDTQEALADTKVGGDLGKELGDVKVESHDPILLNENYLQFENVLYRPVYVGESVTIEGNEALLIFENKYYTSEGVGNCPMCKGAGKVTVERLGLKECPKCEGTGDIQEEPQQEEPQMQQPMIMESKANETCGCKKKAMEANIKNYKSFIETEIDVLKKRAKANEAVGIMYGLPTISKQGRKIKGTLAYAGVSLNDRIYLPEELAKGHGKTLPLLLNHSSVAGAEEELDRLDDEMLHCLENEIDYQVGEVSLTWDPQKLTLYYEGVVDNEFFQKEIDDMDMAVSLGIYYDSDSPKVCDEECYTLIKGAEFREVSLVYHAGFPIATIEAVEAELKARSKLSIAKEEMDQVLSDGSINTSPSDDSIVEEPVQIVQEESVAEEEEDALAQGGSVDVEEKPTGEPLTVDVNEDKPMIVESFYSPDSFSIRGVSGMTISNSNGVERYTFDPTQNFSTNTIHFSVINEGATIFGEQLQPKMTTSDDITKEIESKPDIKIENSGKDILDEL